MRLAIVLVCAVSAGALFAQDRLPTYPGYEQYAKMRGQIAGSVVRASIQPVWAEDGKSVLYRKNGEWVKFDFASKREMPTEAPAARSAPNGTRGAQGFPARGRQFRQITSPDGKQLAKSEDRNVWLANADGSNMRQITTEGDAANRIKLGIASWVYGEELNVRNALWFSPDSKKLAFYRFDESQVLDYYLTDKQIPVQSGLDVEPYPKAGAPNPIADLIVYDVASGKSMKLDCRDGLPFTNDVVGHYVYEVRWSPDGKELYFNRTNRRQNVMEWVAANPETGKCRVVIREEWLPSWTDNSPNITWLNDHRFIWQSERTGFSNLYLYETSGKLTKQLTNHPFEASQIVKVDEKSGWVFYMARSGDNPHLMQLHKVKLDGTGEKRLTDPKFSHSVSISDDNKYFADTYETHDQPPAVRLVDTDGRVVSELMKSDDSKFVSLGLKRAELFKYPAADGKTECYGILMKPSNFDPTKKYPLLVSVYAGPESGMVRERFITPDADTELGFLVAYFDGRGTAGRGKKFKDEVYEKLGVVEIDDQAAGVKYLAQRPYVDGSRVGIEGTSYGGYASLMCLVRHPETFAAACASSSVSDWRNYDTIYTERYMWIPQENASGYDAGSAMKYARNLKGDLMLFYGTADNNVHPSNTLQFIAALGGSKRIEVQVGPDLGHSGLNHDRAMEFFIESLILRRK